ncbi:MAG: DNA cytosine methyltransferase [Deltaproteobacteria bacterium]|nr:DNA cytosine methyltransferase [Deltaproteobacteria bacterium]
MPLEHINKRETKLNKPCPMLVSRGKDSNRRMIRMRPNGLRRLTVRERATIHAFPDDFEFIGSGISCYKRVIHAFPVKLAKIIGKLFIKVR